MHCSTALPCALLVCLTTSLPVITAIGENRVARMLDIKGKSILNKNVSSSVVSKGKIPTRHSPSLDSHEERRAKVVVGEWTQLGSSIEGEGDGDKSGASVSLSKNGRILAIGAAGNFANGVPYAGHVRVYKWANGSWKQMGTDISGKEDWDRMGSSVSLSGDGLTIAIGARKFVNTQGNDLGFVCVYNWDGSSWLQMGGDIVGSDYDFGFAVSMSDDGHRMAVSAPSYGRGPVQVYEWESKSTSWQQIGQNILPDFWGYYHWFGRGLSLAGNGNRLAVGAPYTSLSGYEEYGIVVVYEYDGASWKPLGDVLGNKDGGYAFGYSVAMSHTGNRVVIGEFSGSHGKTYSGKLSVYECHDAAWVQVGGDITGEVDREYFGRVVDISSDGRRVVGYTEAFNDMAGQARVFEWDGTSWGRVGNYITGENQGDGEAQFHFGVSMSGDGTTLALGSPGANSKNGETTGHFRVFEFASESSTGPFPRGFSNNVTCPYLECLAGLIETFDSQLKAFGGVEIGGYGNISLAKTKRSIEEATKHGDIIVSLDRLKQAMKWVQLIEKRGSKLENDSAKAFSKAIGKSGSKCAINLVENFIIALLGQGILADDFLNGEQKKKLLEGRRKVSAGKWKRVVTKCLYSIRMITKELGERNLPNCLQE